MDPYFFRNDVQIISCTLIFMILPSLLLLMQRRNIAVRRKLPPGPFRLPLIGNLHQLGDMPYRSFQLLSAKHGPVMLLQLGSVPTLVISSAEAVSEIFKSHDPVFSGRPVMYATKKLFYGCLDIGFAPYGDYWRVIRKIAVSELFSGKKVESFERVRREEVALTMALIASSSDSPIDLSKTFLCLMNDTICRVALGRKFEANNGFYELLRDTEDIVGGFHVADFFPWLGWIHKFDGLDAKLERTFQKIDKFFDEVIQEHLDPESPKAVIEDLVDVMLRIQADPSQNTLLSNNHIKAVLMDMFIAGTNAPSITLVWTLAELMKNPTVMKKAQEELRQVMGKMVVVEESDLHRMEYLNTLVLKEAMRLHPPAPLLLPRGMTESCTIQGYNIPEKTRVFISAKTIGTDPNSWKNPEQFLPERFVENQIDFRGLDYELIPFGVGRRICPGMNFSVVLIQLVLANLLHCFNWELPPGVDMDMEEAPGITVNKKTPLCFISRKRQTV